MPYQVQQFGVDAPLKIPPQQSPQQATAKAQQQAENLKALGLDDTMLGDLSSAHAALLQQRDAYRSALKSSALQSMGLQSGGVTALGGGAASAGMASGAASSAASGLAASGGGALAASL